MTHKKPQKTPVGDSSREAIASLQGYKYQIYQSALAWIDLKEDEILYLEVAEDFATVAGDALKAVQVKNSTKTVTINSKEIITTIDSFVKLQEENKDLKVTLRHLTTSNIGKEQKSEYRIGDTPTLSVWRGLANDSDDRTLIDLRRVLNKIKLSKKTKNFVNNLDDKNLRQKFLKRIHFDCGAQASRALEKKLNTRISNLLSKKGKKHSQTQNCVAGIMYTLLELSTKSDTNDRFVDRNSLEKLIEKFTTIPLDSNVIENFLQIASNHLSASLPVETNQLQTQLFRPIPITEIPLPKVLASRENDINHLQKTLESVGICWITGSAGMGKTIASRILAHNNSGDWASINLRGKSSEQVASVFIQAADSLKEYGLKGLIIDDLHLVSGPTVQESLHYLVHSANQSDVLLVINSTESPTSEFRFASNLQIDFTRTLSSFTKEDIQEILDKYEVGNANWTKYIYHVSGGGHPQLTMAFIQSMEASGWDINELQTLKSFLEEASAISEIRKNMRMRLYFDLPKDSRRLIERLSLKTGGFNREFAIDLGKLDPQISDAGIILDSLIGAWVDQLEGDRFDLSPLLTGFAEQTLNTNEKDEIHHKIADSLTKNYNFHALDMNSALLSALKSKNEPAILKLCKGILSTSSSDLKKIALYLPVFRCLRTDTRSYPSNATISHMLRGTQILLANLESSSQENINDIFCCFSEEAKNVEHDTLGCTTTLYVLLKLLLQTSKPGLGTSFISVIKELDHLLENKNSVLPAEVLEEMKRYHKDGITGIGVMFINQARQLSKIQELPTVFDFLESSTPELRERLLAPLDHDSFESDIIVSGAWLNEHREGTIDPEPHSGVFKYLEKLALGWNQNDLAVSCRKFRVIIIDEYGYDKNNALAVLNEGLSIYGQNNSELVRAKAKVLHRSDDHEGSLALAKILIESNVPLPEVEKAFLGREAAISAEKLGDYETARRYYLYGSTAALNTKLDTMKAMHIGLMADAALASWHNGDRQTCLGDFVRVLEEVNKIKQDQTPRNAHCHALVRQALLWLELEITGGNFQFKDGTRLTIYPGCVSNPEPHPKIKEHPLLPIDMAWYILAGVENYALINVGITDNLEQHLPFGPLIEGQMLLCLPTMHKAMAQLDLNLFIKALQDTISFYAFAKAKEMNTTEIVCRKVTYDTLPIATKDQQANLQNIAEQFVLLYCAVCIFKGSITSIQLALGKLTDVDGFQIRPELIEHLQEKGRANDFNTVLANLILKGIKVKQGNSPREVFELTYYILQVAKQIGHYQLVIGFLLPWLLEKCSFILENQRFHLKYLQLHEDDIRLALEEDGLSAESRVLKILTAILPTLGIPNQHEISNILSELSK